jgi:phosphoribosylformylglycinamidine cyclo-ligase
VGETYAAAGVDIDAGEELVRRIRSSVKGASRPEVIGGIGGFAGLFALGDGRRDPVLVSSTDGVGTKALVAAEAGRLDTIGIDLVAMCVDDLVCTGAEPLFLLDYVAVGRLDPEAVAAVVGGVAEGCRQAGCALLGGETAEHPGALDPDHFDLAGFAVGVVERDRILPAGVASGDRLIGLPSPGLRCNGYSLARRVLLDVTGLGLDDPAWPDAPRTLGDELLEPSVVYAPAVRRLLGAVDVRALAHVTGGGLVGNLPRVLPDGVDAVVDPRTWERPRIFGEIARLGEVAEEEMARVFNLGIGMVAVVPAAEEGAALSALAAAGVRAATIGEVVPGEGGVQVVGGW